MLFNHWMVKYLMSHESHHDESFLFQLNAGWCSGLNAARFDKKLVSLGSLTVGVVWLDGIRMTIEARNCCTNDNVRSK